LKFAACPNLCLNVFCKKNINLREEKAMPRMKVTMKDKVIKKKNLSLLPEGTEEMSRVAMIQMLIPIALESVAKLLQEEVSELAGAKYSRNGCAIKRWGSNPGSVYLGDRKVSVRVPRIRDVEKKEELFLKNYSDLQNPTIFNEKIFRSVINGLSNRKYEKVAEKVPETFGIKKTSLSKRFILATSKKLRSFLDRDLSSEDFVSIFIDGKSLAQEQIIIAIGITIEGEKRVLGFVESATENEKVCKQFILSLIDRGLNISNKILFIVDGAKGLHKGIKSSLKDKAIFQRCQWHKRENVVSYLSKENKSRFRKKLQKAYEKLTYNEAKNELLKISKELSLINKSAVNSLNEGLEETLTLHKLEIFDKLGRSFKTTNIIESLNSQIEYYTKRITNWHNSSQRQRWIVSALLEIEPSLNKVFGHEHLIELREKMKDEKFLLKLKAA
jgi:putative transposase